MRPIRMSRGKLLFHSSVRMPTLWYLSKPLTKATMIRVISVTPVSGLKTNQYYSILGICCSFRCRVRFSRPTDTLSALDRHRQECLGVVRRTMEYHKLQWRSEVAVSSGKQRLLLQVRYSLCSNALADFMQTIHCERRLLSDLRTTCPIHRQSDLSRLGQQDLGLDYWHWSD